MRFSLLQVETARQPARCPVEESTLDAATRKRSGAILSEGVLNAGAIIMSLTGASFALVLALLFAIASSNADTESHR